MYEFTVRVEVNKTEGKFASADAIQAELVEALEQANPDSISPDDSEYEVIDWSVEAGAPEKIARKAASKDREWLDNVYAMLANAPTLKDDDFLARLHSGLGRYLAK